MGALGSMTACPVRGLMLGAAAETAPFEQLRAASSIRALLLAMPRL